MAKETEFSWQGEKNRTFDLRRPCDCGCDHRQGNLGVGYLTGSDSDGIGFTVWIEKEEVYQRLSVPLEVLHHLAERELPNTS